MRRLENDSKSRSSVSPTACYSIIFCEATAIYGLIIAIILQSKMTQPGLRAAGEAPINEASLYFAGYATFSAGIAVGLTNIASGCACGGAGSLPAACRLRCTLTRLHVGIWMRCDTL